MYRAFVLSVLLQFTASDYPCGIFKPFFELDIAARNGRSTIQMSNSELDKHSIRLPVNVCCAELTPCFSGVHVIDL